MFFFKPYAVGIIIPQTNIRLKEEKHHPVSYGVFLCWLHLWFLTATINGPEHMDFLSMGEIDCFVGAPMRLGTFMSRKQLEAILKALAITARQPPAFSDCFWEVREIIEAWNANMTEQFLVCLLLGRVHEYMDKQVQLPRMDVCSMEAMAIWE